MKLLDKIKNIKGLKYIVATVLFLLVIVFIDDYSLRVSSRLSRQVRDLHNEEIALSQAILQDSTANALLRDNLDAKEHYGRENYYMKRPDEDIFVIK